MDRWEDFRGPLDLGNWHNIERRIGARVPSPAIPVRLVAGDDAPGDDGMPGNVVEVSVTGGAVEGPEVAMELPAAVRVAHQGSESTATVRHMTPTPTPGVTRYGVEWGWLEEPLRSVVYGVVADARPAGSPR